MADTDYLRRTVDAALDDLMPEGGAILVTGPRACGKTTTARKRAESLTRLDVPGERAQFESDADVALARLPRPALLDEWQFAPEVLPAVKRSIDDDPDAEPFLLTGSARSNRSPDLWPGTGRLSRVRMYGLSEAELSGAAELDVVSRLLSDSLPVADPALDLTDYLGRAVRGGMPQPRLRGLSPLRWYGNYLEQLVDRDLAGAGYGADADRLRAYVTAIAANLAGAPADNTLHRAAGITAKTAHRYNGILEDLGLLERVPAWTSNRLSRLSSRHKLYLTDTGLAAAALGVDLDDLMADGVLFGAFIDAFVAAQLRPALAALRPHVRLHHLRSSDGRNEVDLLLDLGHRGVIAIEVKAASAVSERDARHLVWMREQIGQRFLRGIVLHTGPASYDLDERIVAAPISTLWAR